jgi:peptidylprolyl isomerase
MSKHNKNHKHPNTSQNQSNKKIEENENLVLLEPSDLENINIQTGSKVEQIIQSEPSTETHQDLIKEPAIDKGVTSITNSDDQLDDDYAQIEKLAKDESINQSIIEPTSKVEAKEDYLYNKDEKESKSSNLFLKTIFLVALLALLGYFVLGYGNVTKPASNASNQASITKIDKKPCINNNQKMDIPTNLKIEDTIVGTGKEVFSGCEIKIHYKGYIEPTQQETDEKKEVKEFDNSFKRGTPFSTQIGVGKLIKGWDIGIIGMKEGGKRKLTIPSDLAYGDIELPGIPAKSTLVFEVELIQVLD